MWTTRSRTWERELVAECEEFLFGRYAQYLRGQNRAVPTWAWLNLLAHGNEQDITTLAVSGSPRPSSSDIVWQEALAFLAQELMSEATRRGLPLVSLQRSTLVPLELEFAGRRGPVDAQPVEFVSSVLRALTQHRTSRPQ
jgi:hypothetical protein